MSTDISQLPPDLQAVIAQQVAAALAGQQAAAEAAARPRELSAEEKLDAAFARIEREWRSERTHPHEVTALLAALHDALSELHTYVRSFTVAAATPAVEGGA